MVYNYIIKQIRGFIRGKGENNMLFSSGKINELELKNRWIMLAMHTGFSIENSLSERELAFYEARAKGGAGAITLVMGVNTEGTLKGMLNGQTMKDWSEVEKLSQTLHEHGCKLIIQLFHCGRNESKKEHGDRPLLAPSAIASSIFKNTPSEMTSEDIKCTTEDFGKVALKCKNAGADAVEISASTGYLLSQFFSPLDNQRIDEFGGGLENRLAFPLQVAERVRDAVGQTYPLMVKISGAQMVEGGYTIEDMIVFCCKLEEKRLADAITVTGGWHESPIQQISYHVPKGGYAFFAQAIKAAVSLPIIACNRIHDRETGQQLIDKGMCDFVGTARGFLCEPEFVTRMEQNKPFNICQACNKCIQKVLTGEEVTCGYNPEVGNEYMENSHRRIATQKKVLVIGGGPGGLLAAKKSAERGYKTTLCTKEAKLGGQMNLAMLPPGKQDIKKFLEYMEYELKELGVEVLFNTEVDAEYALNFKPYFVVVVTGSVPTKPEIKGIDAKNVFMSNDVFNGDGPFIAQLKKGKTVVLGGGSLGLEVAEFLYEQSKVSLEASCFHASIFEQIGMEEPSSLDLQIIEKSPHLGVELGSMKYPVLEKLKDMDIKMMTESEIESIGDGYVLVNGKQEKLKIPADHVIIATGSIPSDSSFVSRLEDERISYAIIGDANCVGDAMMALGAAYELFLRMYIA